MVKKDEKNIQEGTQKEKGEVNIQNVKNYWKAIK